LYSDLSKQKQNHFLYMFCSHLPNVLSLYSALFTGGNRDASKAHFGFAVGEAQTVERTERNQNPKQRCTNSTILSWFRYRPKLYFSLFFLILQLQFKLQAMEQQMTRQRNADNDKSQAMSQVSRQNRDSYFFVSQFPSLCFGYNAGADTSKRLECQRAQIHAIAAGAAG
jgi:hypothetical protein